MTSWRSCRTSHWHARALDLQDDMRLGTWFTFKAGLPWLLQHCRTVRTRIRQSATSLRSSNWRRWVKLYWPQSPKKCFVWPMSCGITVMMLQISELQLRRFGPNHGSVDKGSCCQVRRQTCQRLPVLFMLTSFHTVPCFTVSPEQCQWKTLLQTHCLDAFWACMCMHIQKKYIYIYSHSFVSILLVRMVVFAVGGDELEVFLMVWW